MLSDKWLSKYELLENFNPEIPLFEHVLNLDPVAPVPGHGPCGPMELKESQSHRVYMVLV